MWLCKEAPRMESSPNYADRTSEKQHKKTNNQLRIHMWMDVAINVEQRLTVMIVRYPPRTHSRRFRYSNACSPTSSNAIPHVVAWRSAEQTQKQGRKKETIKLIFSFLLNTLRASTQRKMRDVRRGWRLRAISALATNNTTVQRKVQRHCPQ